MVTPAEREAVLQHFEQGLAQVDCVTLPVERMRWHCRLTDPRGERFIVAEYSLKANGDYRRLWVLPDALWPSKPHG